MIPEKYLDLLEGAVVVNIITLMPDGHPQATPVWAGWDGEHILINTAVGRQKEANVRADPRVTVLAVDPQNPYRYLEVRGRVVSFETGDTAEATIDGLAKQYLNKDRYHGEGGVVPEERREPRITFVIAPTHTNAMG